MKISEDKIVSLTYDLTVEDELMESATKERPLIFLFGMGMMLEAFEKQLEGKETGDHFAFTLSPSEAYGEHDDKAVVELPKNIFEVDGKFDDQLVIEGATLPMMDSNGNRLMGSVIEILPEVVVLDFNHPLAGETLHFEGEVVDVHTATAEEIAALTQPYDEGCNCESCDTQHYEEGCGCGCGH
jgi:FKBP-type peptidyl-prolyl cis-trans isomerase SlyD